MAQGHKQHTLGERAGLTDQLIHQELRDHKKVRLGGRQGEGEDGKGSVPKKLARKGGTTLSYAAQDSKSSQRFARPEEYAGFWLCDPREKRIGMVEKLFMNWSGEPEYISLRMGFFGLKSVLLPVQDFAVDEQRRILVLQ